MTSYARAVRRQALRSSSVTLVEKRCFSTAKARRFVVLAVAGSLPSEAFSQYCAVKVSVGDSVQRFLVIGMLAESAYLQALTEQSGKKVLPALAELVSLHVRVSCAHCMYCC